MRVYMQRNADNIINRRPFKEATIEGYYYGKYYVINSYRTPYYYGKYYVINSYRTPIAAYDPDNNLWYLTVECHSKTTSTQQSALRLILSEKKTIRLSPDMFHAQIKEIQNKGIGK